MRGSYQFWPYRGLANPRTQNCLIVEATCGDVVVVETGYVPVANHGSTNGIRLTVIPSCLSPALLS